MSYADFLTKVVAARRGRAAYYQTRAHGLFGVGIDADLRAGRAGGSASRASQGMKLEPGYVQGMNRDAMRSDEAEAYFFHFPDGNATVARLLVRALVPRAMPRRAPPTTW